MLLKCTDDVAWPVGWALPREKRWSEPRGGAGLGGSLLNKHNPKCRSCGLRWYYFHFSEPTPLGWAWLGLQEEEVGRSGHHINSKMARGCFVCPSGGKTQN